MQAARPKPCQARCSIIRGPGAVVNKRAGQEGKALATTGTSCRSDREKGFTSSPPKPPMASGIMHDETDAQSVYVACPKSHRQEMAKRAQELGSDFKALALFTET